MKGIRVVPDPEVPAEVLANAIVQVAAAARSLLNSRLNADAVGILITNSIPVKHRIGLRTVRLVLEHASLLEATYLRRAK